MSTINQTTTEDPTVANQQKEEEAADPNPASASREQLTPSPMQTTPSIIHLEGGGLGTVDDGSASY